MRKAQRLSLYLRMGLWGVVWAVAMSGVAAAQTHIPARYKELATAVGEHSRLCTSDHFLLIHDGPPDYARRSLEVSEAAHVDFYQTFTPGFPVHSLETPLVWACFGSHDNYERYSREADLIDMSALDGYYSTRTNRVAFVWPHASRRHRPLPEDKAQAIQDPTATTYPSPDEADAVAPPMIDRPRTRHETAHQLAFNSGLLAPGVMYPLWVSEGLAANFEFDALTTSAPGANNIERLQSLLEAVRDGELIPLESFATLTRVQYADASASVLYAEAWALFNFLYSHDREGLRQYLEALAQLSPGRRDEARLREEFEAAFGSISRLAGPWAQFLEGLRQDVAD